MTEEVSKDLDVITELPEQVIKYPHYIPIEVIRDRERQRVQRKQQNLVRDDITKLSSEIRILHRELTMMKDLPGPAMCKKCHIVAMSWKKLSCGHLLCHACLHKGIDARKDEIIIETQEKNRNKRELISHHLKFAKVDESDPKQVCVFCRPNDGLSKVKFAPKNGRRHTAYY